MKVKYSKKFPYAPYLNEDIGFECDVVPKEGVSMEASVLDALDWLKGIAEKFHKDNNPQLVGPNEGWMTTFQEGHGLNSSPIPQPLQSIDPKKRDEVEIAIDNAVNVEDLYPLKEDALANGIMWIYQNKLRKFQ
jgi:hypothetical protein